MECDICGTDGDVFDEDTDEETVVLFFACFNEECENSAEQDGHEKKVYRRVRE